MRNERSVRIPVLVSVGEKPTYDICERLVAPSAFGQREPLARVLISCIIEGYCMKQTADVSYHRYCWCMLHAF